MIFLDHWTKIILCGIHYLFIICAGQSTMNENWSKNSCFCLVVCGANFISAAPLTNAAATASEETRAGKEPYFTIIEIMEKAKRVRK